MSEAGIHRPPVAGIAGSSLVGSQSIVLSGGYEDDKVLVYGSTELMMVLIENTDVLD